MQRKALLALCAIAMAGCAPPPVFHDPFAEGFTQRLEQDGLIATETRLAAIYSPRERFLFDGSLSVDAVCESHDPECVLDHMQGLDWIDGAELDSTDRRIYIGGYVVYSDRQDRCHLNLSRPAGEPTLAPGETEVPWRFLLDCPLEPKTD